MGRTILIISEAETFFIRGIEMKLKNLGMETVYCAPTIKDLEASAVGKDLIILNTDENVDKLADMLVYLKDRCMEKDEKIMMIGTVAEYNTVTQYLPIICIQQLFERPLNMEQLLDNVEKYLSDEAIHERRKSILIVDDDVSYMTMIFEWLKGKYRVSMVNSGMKAITHLAKNHTDLILLDYEMPVTSGPQVLEMIRSEAETSDIPVMFLTGKNDKTSIMKVLELKPTDYLLKTIDKQGLMDKLDNYFYKQKNKQ